MDDFDMWGFHTEKLAELPTEIKTQAVEWIQGAFAETVKEEIRAMFEADRDHWCAPHHHFWGMAIRNALRTEAGITDDLLPSGNWDDYYVPVVELALGLR